LKILENFKNLHILLKNFPKAIGMEKFQYFRHFSKFPKTFENSLSVSSLYVKIMENLKNFHILLKIFPKAKRSEKFQYLRHFSKFPKTLKNSLIVSVRLIILENFGKF
jgi:ABC-type maltose transport system permease subunit